MYLVGYFNKELVYFVLISIFAEKKILMIVIETGKQ